MRTGPSAGGAGAPSAVYASLVLVLLAVVAGGGLGVTNRGKLRVCAAVAAVEAIVVQIRRLLTWARGTIRAARGNAPVPVRVQACQKISLSGESNEREHAS